MLVPKARGELSEQLFATLRTGTAAPERIDVATDDADRHISLWALHELHYRGFDDTDDALEWDPDLIAVRGQLERWFEGVLRERFDAYDVPREDSVVDALQRLVAEHEGASAAQFVRQHATREQALELLQERSVYTLKESDPTEWVVPRLAPRTKAAVVELQFDEFGGGDPNRLHAHLFTRGLEACGLRSEYGAYVDDVLPETLAINNAMSMFGLNRRLRGAVLGHLAAFEATSSLPSRALAQGLERLGLAPEIIEYYTEHVEADAVHEQLALRTICGSLVEDEPNLADDVLLGAFTCLDLEDRFATAMLDRWAA